MYSNQARRFHLSDRRDQKIKDILVLIQISNVYTNPEFHLIIDPWHLVKSRQLHSRVIIDSKLPLWTDLLGLFSRLPDRSDADSGMVLALDFMISEGLRGYR